MKKESAFYLTLGFAMAASASVAMRQMPEAHSASDNAALILKGMEESRLRYPAGYPSGRIDNDYTRYRP